jgi:hypothetical protein
MLPPGLTAQPADRADHHALRRVHPAAQTVVRLVVGACACDLVRQRDADAREDERAHRDRWRRTGGSRETLIAAIERHRRGAGLPAPSGGWPRALAAFVAEHARNAGETLYLLRFAGEPATPEPGDRPVHRLRASDVLARADGWLQEHAPVLVAP